MVDDHPIVRAGLRDGLRALPEVEIVGEVGNGRDLPEALETLQPNLLVMDVNMPDFEPVAAARQIRAQYPSLKILIVSAYDDQSYVVGLLSAGVDGYHLKDQPLSDLQLAVRRIMAGDRWISSSLVDSLVDHRPEVAAPVAPSLTRRQRELLRLLSQGYDNRRIAREMDLSVKTVESHLTGLYRSIGVVSRLEAHDYAMRHPEIFVTTAQAALQARPEARPAAHLTILLVDDNARYRMQLGKMISKTYSVSSFYEAEDSGEALRLAGQVHPQLAFIDVVLPEEDGIQCARRIKAISPTTRLILISAYPDREFHRLGISAGAVAFLDKKDIDVASVRQVLEDALGQSLSG